MRLHFYSFAALLLTLLLGMQACTTPDSEVNPDTNPDKGTVTEVGKPLAAPTSKIIGAAGGAITTPDGKLTLTFPAGALDKETTVTIQPVENKAINGIGIGYEFGPDGSKFAKPITFTYHYTDEEMIGASPEAMGLATQTKDHSWVLERFAKVDKEAHTITGQLKHFSWWSLITFYAMSPQQAVLGPSQTVDIEIIQAGDIPAIPTKESDYDVDMLTPLLQLPVKPLLIKNISLNGNSNLSQTTTAGYPDGEISYNHLATGAVVQYRAPATIPKKNPAAISVELALPSKAMFMLVCNVTIQNENTFTIKGKVFDDVQVTATFVQDRFYLSMMDRSNPHLMGSMMIRSSLMSEGSAPFELEKTGAVAGMEGGDVQGQSSYTDACKGAFSTSGVVTIKKIYTSNGHKFIEGTVTGTLSQEYGVDSRTCAVTVNKTFEISANFKTQLNQ